VYTLGPSTPGGVAYLAHVFGFVAGMLVGLLVRAASARPAPPP
jgi:membrane associated rhomboid family serine protease